MITGKLLKNSTYVLIGIGILVCLYQLKNWHVYPWIQILTCLVIPLFSILLTELAGPVKENIRVTIWITGILQLILSLIIIPNNELVDTYWRFVFFPSLFSILLLTYAVSLRKDEKYQPLFKVLVLSILIGISIRFIIYHPFVDYIIEILFLILLILIFRAKNKRNETEIIPVE